jgi:hypothetical protein
MSVHTRVGLVLLTSACGSSPAVPTPTPVAVVTDCQQRNSALVTLENRSTTNSTYTIPVGRQHSDGPRARTTEHTYTKAASVAHTMQFRYTNTSLAACSTSTPTLVQCSTNTYWCTF